MRFTNRFFFTLVSLFISLFAERTVVYGLPLPRPAAIVKVSDPKPLKARADPDDREDHMLALRDFMDNVQNLGGSPYGRSLLRRTMPVATTDKVAMPTQLKSSSSGFIFLPVVGGGQASTSSSSPSDGQEKVGAAPVRQTMFINIEAPSGGQLAKIDIPGVKGDAKKKDESCDEDKKKDAGTANKQVTDKADNKDQDQGQSGPGNGGNTGAGASSDAGTDSNQGAPSGDQTQGSAAPGGQSNSQAGKQDDGNSTPPDTAAGPGNGANASLADMPPSASNPSVIPTPKTTLQAPAGIDETKKTKVVFKPLTDPDPPAPDSKAVIPPVKTPPPASTPPPSAAPSSAPPASNPPASTPASTPPASGSPASDPPASTPDLGNTGAAPDNADDKKPDPKNAAAAGVQGGPAVKSTQPDITPPSSGNPAADPVNAATAAVPSSTNAPADPSANPANSELNPPVSLSTANATTPPAAVASTNPAGGASNKDYFIYPVEQNDKLVDLKKGDMVAYVDKSGNLGNDGGSQAVKQMLNGGSVPPSTQPSSQPSAVTPPTGTPPPLKKRTHPRMWDLERRAVTEMPVNRKKKRAEAAEKKPGFDLRPGAKDSTIAYYGQPIRRSFRV